MASYIQVPNEIAIADIADKGHQLSATVFKRALSRAAKTVSVRSFLDHASPFMAGTEPGSTWYMTVSPKKFLRTRCLQSHSRLLYPRGDAITPVNPGFFIDPGFKDGDILLSKDSNIGECAVVKGDVWKDHMFSGGIVKLNTKVDHWYLFSFLKHPSFKEQLDTMVPLGATIRHAGTKWMDCLIPLPDQKNAAEVKACVSEITQALVDMEFCIRLRHEEMLKEFEDELMHSVRPKAYSHTEPSVDEILNTGRLDAALYSPEFKHFKWLVDTYKHGSTNFDKMGARSRRGPNLAVSVIGHVLYSEDYQAGWYELIRPVNISEYGTLEQREWLGTRRSLPILKKGDMILGCEGFEKGRSFVVVDELDRCTTNFHGTVISIDGAELYETIFLRACFAFLREKGIIDLVGVGGSGGHMSPDYFSMLPIPKYPKNKRIDIAHKYSTSAKAATPDKAISFLKWRQERNKQQGVIELSRDMKLLEAELHKMQEGILEGVSVKLPTWFRPTQ